MEDHELSTFEALSRKCARVYSQLGEFYRAALNIAWIFGSSPFAAAGIGIFQAGSGLFINGLILGVLYLGGSMVTRAELSEGDLMAYLVSAQTIQKALSQTSVLFGQVRRGFAVCG